MRFFRDDPGDAIPLEPPGPLTEAEKASLAACAGPHAWRDVLDAIKRARAFRLPPDWSAYAIDSGLVERATGISVEEALAHPLAKGVGRSRINLGA